MNEIIRLLRRSKAVQRLCFRQSTAAHIQASRPFSRKFQFIGPLHPVSFLYVSIRLPGNSCLYVFYHVKFVLHVSCKYAPCALYPASQDSCPLMILKTQMSVLQQSGFFLGSLYLISLLNNSMDCSDNLSKCCKGCLHSRLTPAV